jgi:hypothetical protein
MWDGKRRIRTSILRRVVDETWALWAIPSYVCSGDSGGGIFLNPGPNGPDGEVLAANVSDGGRDCRRHNNKRDTDSGSSDGHGRSLHRSGHHARLTASVDPDVRELQTWTGSQFTVADVWINAARAVLVMAAALTVS